MKRTSSLFIVASLLLSAPCIAQIQKGNILAGGDIANFNLGLKNGSAFTMRIDPKLAFFLQNNFALGAYIDFELSSFSGNTDILYGVGALARYYLNDRNNQNPLRHSRFFVEGNIGITGENVSGGSGTNGLGLGIGPGYAYFITPNIGLETLLKYNGVLGFGNATTQSDLNLNVGFQIYLPTRSLRAKLANDTKK